MNHCAPARLDDFVDELLPPAEREAVARHIQGCDACRERVASLRALADELASLPREVAPGRDLRPGSDLRPREAADASAAPDPPATEVATVTAASADHGRRAAWLRAAAVVALLVTAGVLSRALTRSAGDASAPTAQPLLPAAPYAAAHDELRALVAARRDALDPAALHALERNLTSVDRAIRELEAARESDPADTDLAHLLESQYRTRLELLRGAAALVAEDA